MATAYKEKTNVPVHLIISQSEARYLKAYLRNYLGGEDEEHEAGVVRGDIFHALQDAGIEG